MSTGDRKAAAQAARVEQAERAARGDRRRRRMLLGGVVAIALAAVAIAVALSSSGGGDGATRSPAAATRHLAGIPQDGITLGRPDAPVLVREFADLQCPFCAQAAAGPVRELIDGPVRAGQARLEYRDLAFLGDDSVKAARAAVAAGAEDRLWNFVEVFYARQGEENSGYVTSEFLQSVARDAGIEPARIESASNEQVMRALTQASSLGRRYRVASTPTFVVIAAGAAPKVVDADGVVAAVREAAGA